MSDTVTIQFTREELWELMNNYDASFADGAEDNELATHVSQKLSTAYEKLTK